MMSVVVLLALVYAIAYFTTAFMLRTRARRDDTAPARPMLSPATLPEE